MEAPLDLPGGDFQEEVGLSLPPGVPHLHTHRLGALLRLLRVGVARRWEKSKELQQARSCIQNCLGIFKNP
jgi:hypothetical protein